MKDKIDCNVIANQFFANASSLISSMSFYALTHAIQKSVADYREILKFALVVKIIEEYQLYILYISNVSL